MILYRSSGIEEVSTYVLVDFFIMSELGKSKRPLANGSSLATVASPMTKEILDDLDKTDGTFWANNQV